MYKSLFVSFVVFSSLNLAFLQASPASPEMPVGIPEAVGGNEPADITLPEATLPESEVLPLPGDNSLPGTDEVNDGSIEVPSTDIDTVENAATTSV